MTDQRGERKFGAIEIAGDLVCFRVLHISTPHQDVVFVCQEKCLEGGRLERLADPRMGVIVRRRKKYDKEKLVL